MFCRQILKQAAPPLVRCLRDNVFPIEVLMQKHQIMPDATKKAPSRVCDVFWDRTRARANLGNVVEPWKLMQQPCIQWISDVEKMYTIVMMNVDMPHRSKPTMRNFVHWVVGNIPGPHIDDGETLVEYIGPAPPEDSGLHRIVFFVFLQEAEITFDERCISRKMGKQRSSWSLEKLINKYNLLGPVGCNYVMVEYDPDVKPLLVMMGLEKLIPKKNKKGY